MTDAEQAERERERAEDIKREGARHLWPLFAAAALVQRKPRDAIALADEMVEAWKARQVRS